MNTNLVKSLVKTIESLTPEERKLFEQEFILMNKEITTKEITHLAEQSNTFNFLLNEPDIYTLEDGEPI
jgi:hypothetical protein